MTTPRLPLGQVIATRQLDRKRDDGSVTPVEARIGAPVPYNDLTNKIAAWACSYEVVGIDDDIVRTVIGGDSIQALYFALVAAGAAITSSVPHRAGKVTWLGFPEVGFPAHDPMLPPQIAETIKNDPGPPGYLQALQDRLKAGGGTGTGG
jgi:hypothetical protein